MLKMLATTIMMMIMNNKSGKLCACLFLLSFNLNSHQPELVKISYKIVGDLLSFWITNLSIWIILMISIMKTTHPNLFYMTNSFMMIILMLTFYTWNFLVFFILFEISMVVIVIMVMAWGYQPERIEATLFMIMFTSLFSLPFFSSLMNNLTKLNFWMLECTLTTWDYLSFMLIFMVKMPVYFIHVWLPKVHVESPVHGSMVLASIMLKLGCYGLLRMTNMIVKINSKTMFAVMSFATWTTLVLSLICGIQSDLKSLIAYSSIVHMTTTFMGIMLLKPKSVFASMVMMLGHGLCSSAMFFMCNQMYKSTKSRSILINKGALAGCPTAKFTWFFICMANAPMPPAINILGELFLFKSAISWSSMNLLITFLIMFISSCYSIIAFCIPAHGQPTALSHNPKWMDAKALIISTMHILPAILMVIKPTMMTIC